MPGSGDALHFAVLEQLQESALCSPVVWSFSPLAMITGPVNPAIAVSSPCPVADDKNHLGCPNGIRSRTDSGGCRVHCELRFGQLTKSGQVDGHTSEAVIEEWDG